MDGRRGSPARLLAPISLIAFTFALFIVIAGSDTGDDEPNREGDRASQRQGANTTTETVAGDAEPTVQRTFYTVKTGDTLAAISETVGVPITRLQELNPELDPQALVSGQKIRLRE